MTTQAQYDEKKVDELKDLYPDAAKVTILYRGSGLPRCEPMEVQYVKATSGKWGRSSETRIGLGLKKAKERLKAIRNLRPRVAVAWEKRGWVS